MNVLCIGDPHGNLAAIRKMPLRKADAIILTGDLGNADLARGMAFENIRRMQAGKPLKQYTANQRYRAFIQEYDSGVKLVKHLARHAPVYLIYGNGEHTDTETRQRSRKLGVELPSITEALKQIHGVHIINNRVIELDGKRIGGLPFFDDYDEREVRHAKTTLQRLGKLDVLVCHQPPQGYLDTVRNKDLPKSFQGQRVGSPTILKYVRKARPKLLLCGHIHEGKGTAKIGSTTAYNLGTAGHKLLKL